LDYYSSSFVENKNEKSNHSFLGTGSVPNLRIKPRNSMSAIPQEMKEYLFSCA
jgi:hypothetical protein